MQETDRNSVTNSNRWLDLCREADRRFGRFTHSTGGNCEMPQVIEPTISSAEKASGRQLHTASLNELGKEYNTRTWSNVQTASSSGVSLRGRLVVLTYGVFSYVIFFATFCYAVGWVGNLWVPKSIDSAPVGPVWQALLVNTLLLAVFAVQHSVMARPCLQAVVDLASSPNRRTEHLCLPSSLALLLMFWQWQPLGGVIWNVENTTGRLLLHSMFGFGWLLVLATTFLINHFDLFGLRQVWLFARRKGISAAWLRHSRTLPVGAASALCGLAVCVLVHADDDRSTSLVCRRDNSLHPGRDST